MASLPRKRFWSIISTSIEESKISTLDPILLIARHDPLVLACLMFSSDLG